MCQSHTADPKTGSQFRFHVKIAESDSRDPRPQKNCSNHTDAGKTERECRHSAAGSVAVKKLVKAWSLTAPATDISNPNFQPITQQIRQPLSHDRFRLPF
jgi:hypothetical protein